MEEAHIAVLARDVRKSPAKPAKPTARPSRDVRLFIPPS